MIQIDFWCSFSLFWVVMSDSAYILHGGGYILGGGEWWWVVVGILCMVVSILLDLGSFCMFWGFDLGGVGNGGNILGRGGYILGDGW